MRVYVSSTFEDLEDHRRAAISALHQLGHEVVAMEYYGAGTAAPLSKVLADIDGCDVYVGIFAWRYGFRPDATADTPKLRHTKPGKTSITEYEYRKAQAGRLEVLAFLADERAPWPASFIDGVARPQDATDTERFRSELQKEKVVAFFSTPDSLASQVATAVATIGLRSEISRGLLTPVRTEQAVPVLAGQSIYDSHVVELKKFVLQAVDVPVVHVDLDNTWWASRLYLLAALGETYGVLRRIAFLSEGRFIGVAAASSIRREMIRVYDANAGPSPLRQFEAYVSSYQRSTDLDTELNDLVAKWQELAGANDEKLVPAHPIISAENVRWFFGESLLTSTLRVADLSALTVLDLQRILDFPSDVVPVEQTRRRSRRRVQLVDKLALTDTVARNAVREMLDRLGLS